MSIVKELDKAGKKIDDFTFLDKVERVNELLLTYVYNYSSKKYSCELIEIGENDAVENGVLQGLEVIDDLDQAVWNAWHNKIARLNILFARKHNAVIVQYENYFFRTQELDKEISRYEIFAETIDCCLKQGMPGFETSDYYSITDYVANLKERRNKAFLYVETLEVKDLPFIIDDLIFSNAYK